jgi:hypothetical protein
MFFQVAYNASINFRARRGVTLASRERGMRRKAARLLRSERLSDRKKSSSIERVGLHA